MLCEMYVPHVMSQERIEQHTHVPSPQKLSQTPLTGGGAAIERNMALPYQPASWKFRTILPNGSVVRRFLLLFFRHESHPATISPSSKQFKYASKCFPLWWKSHCHLGNFFIWLNTPSCIGYLAHILVCKICLPTVPTSLVEPKVLGVSQAMNRPSFFLSQDSHNIRPFIRANYDFRPILKKNSRKTRSRSCRFGDFRKFPQNMPT